MKKCTRQKCQKEFEPNKPKQKFCSDKCRVYHSRENKGKPAAVLPSKIAVVVKKSLAPGSPKNLEELKKLCPPELTGFERSAWIAENRQKYGI